MARKSEKAAAEHKVVEGKGNPAEAAILESGLAPVPIFETPEEAASKAREDAEKAGITNKAAVMYSAPGGYGTGAD